MLLNKDQIQLRSLVGNDDARCYRDVSYDLRIGQIFNSNGEEVQRISLGPQCMVRVVSEENLQLPSNILGYAVIKTELCDRGLLAINIGIVDPSWNLPVSSTLINFGKSSYPLSKGDVFLRVTFHEFDPCATPAQAPQMRREDYVRGKSVLAASSFSPTFLNIEETARQAAHKFVGEAKTRIFVWVSVIALLITAGTSLATTYSALMATRAYMATDQARFAPRLQELETAIEQERKLSKENEKLQAELKQLHRQLLKALKEK